MANPKKTEMLTLKLLKSQDPSRYYKYHKQIELIAEEQFFDKVCRKTRNSDGDEVPLLDKNGNPEYYQLGTILDLEVQTGTITEEQKSILLQDPRFKDPATQKLKIFPHKVLLSVTRTLTEADGREWLKTRWQWEGLDINFQQVHEIPFNRENFEKEVSKRSAPKDEKHIIMTLQKISTNGIKYPYVYQIEDREQFLTRPFNELWDYIASAPLKDSSKTKIGQEKDKEKNQQYG